MNNYQNLKDSEKIFLFNNEVYQKKVGYSYEGVHSDHEIETEQNFNRKYEQTYSLLLVKG